MTSYFSRWQRILTAILFLGLLSCVTVNIYFPAEEVKRAAEDIVGEIREQPPGSSLPPRTSHLFASFHLAWGLPTAHAQSETTVSNASIRAIKGRLKARDAQLAPYFNKGAIGENNRGYIDIRDIGELDMKSKAAVKRLVDAENQDRRQLYQEVARTLNIDSSQLDRIESIFAREWQKSARSGWHIQREDNQWVQK